MAARIVVQTARLVTPHRDEAPRVALHDVLFVRGVAPRARRGDPRRDTRLRPCGGQRVQLEQVGAQVLRVVAHAGRWYVATADRSFRLDRITSVKLLAATTTEAPAGDPADAVLRSLASTPWTHQVSVRVAGTVGDVERRLPLGLAVITSLDSESPVVRIQFRAERLDWVPALLAGLDRPFVIEEPPELRQRVADFADRLATWVNG